MRNPKGHAAEGVIKPNRGASSSAAEKTQSQEKEAEELADVRAIVEQAGWAVYKTKKQRQAEKKSARRVPGQG